MWVLCDMPAHFVSTTISWPSHTATPREAASTASCLLGARRKGLTHAVIPRPQGQVQIVAWPNPAPGPLGRRWVYFCSLTA